MQNINIRTYARIHIFCGICAHIRTYVCLFVCLACTRARLCSHMYVCMYVCTGKGKDEDVHTHGL